MNIEHRMGKDERRDEHRTSNVQHRMLNKVFCQFINWRSGATSLFDVRRSMFDVGRSSFNMLALARMGG